MTKPLRIPLGPQIYSQFLSCMTNFFLSQARRSAGRVVDLKLSNINFYRPDSEIHVFRTNNMPNKVPNIQRIINNSTLKIVNIVFSRGGSCSPLTPPPSPLCTALIESANWNLKYSLQSLKFKEHRHTIYLRSSCSSLKMMSTPFCASVLLITKGDPHI